MAVALVSTSCSSDDGGGGSSAGVNAKVDGKSFKSYVAQATQVSNTLVIQSSDKQGRSIQIMIMDFDGVGTYVSGDDNPLHGYVQYTGPIDINNPMDVDAYTSVKGTGTVEITEINETGVKGTFTATAVLAEEDSTESVAITNGTINVQFGAN